MEKNKQLWQIVSGLWKEGKDFSTLYKKFYDYYDGKLTKNYFGNEDKTSNNIIEEIIETKVISTLDAPFTIQVVPSLSPLKDISEIKNQQIIADIFNEELHHVLKNNNFEELKEQIVRFGEIMGFSPLQTLIEEENGKAEVKLQYITPENIRFDKTAKKACELSFIAYKQIISPSLAKDRYCKNEDGTYDEEKCKLIDSITSSIVGGKSDANSGRISAYETENTSGLVFSGGTSGIQAGKSIELVVMFLIDTTVYAPEKNDSAEISQAKQEYIQAYPNGRLIVFSMKENLDLILEDKPAPEGFKGLGNIDIFNPVTMDRIEGKSEVEDLIPIQNRINGTLATMAFLVSQNINTIMVPEGSIDLADSDLIKQSVTKMARIQNDGSNVPFVLKNESILEAAKLETMLQRYERQAYQKAKLNETMINGARQVGTTSGEQVESLNESPMASIRMIQKNLKNFIIEVGNKIVKLIQEFYTENRIIEIATGVKIDNEIYKYAEMSITPENEQIINFYSQAGVVAKQIKINKDWEYKIEVVSGTDIPRSRKELAGLVEKIFSAGLLNVNQDLDILELYLKSLDLPNYRAFINLLRQKQDTAKQNQPQIDIRTIMMDVNLSKNFKDILDALSGFSTAKGQILSSVGLKLAPDTIQTAPVQEITAKSDAKDISTISPDKISTNPQEQQEGLENIVIDKEISKGA